ncbi:MAG TPA: SurA N-terminal domain-containing protein, partial [Elusimicrobiales bacterium]|nr:SurA N-terminal domain-containing protein [Elusimicrobiales bacterium]
MTRIALAVLALAAAPACARVIGEAVATVNGKSLLMSEFRKNVEAKLEYYKRAAPAMLEQKDAMYEIEQEVLDSMVTEQLLQQEGEKEKVRILDRDIEDGVAKIKKRFEVDDEGRPIAPAEAEKTFMEEMKKEGLT